MIIKNEYGDAELYCDECGLSLEDDDEVYEVDDRILCLYCLKLEFRKKD